MDAHYSKCKEVGKCGECDGFVKKGVLEKKGHNCLKALTASIKNLRVQLSSQEISFGAQLKKKDSEIASLKVRDQEREKHIKKLVNLFTVIPSLLEGDTLLSRTIQRNRKQSMYQKEKNVDDDFHSMRDQSEDEEDKAKENLKTETESKSHPEEEPKSNGVTKIDQRFGDIRFDGDWA